MELDRPVPVRLPRGAETVTAVRFHVDDPGAFLDRVRQHVPASGTS